MTQSVNVQIIARLANNKVSAAAEQYGALPLDIQESLTRQISEQRQEVVDAAASEIVALLSNKDEFLVFNATQIAALQAQIENLTALQGKIQLATNYGLSTSNFLPLVKITASGCIPLGTDKASTEVPKDWTAPVAA